VKQQGRNSPFLFKAFQVLHCFTRFAHCSASPPPNTNARERVAGAQGRPEVEHKSDPAGTGFLEPGNETAAPKGGGELEGWYEPGASGGARARDRQPPLLPVDVDAVV
jgi:hypothetical protein